MTPRSILRDLCDRYGLPEADGERLLPLIERALKAPPGVRERILELVEDNLQRESRRRSACLEQAQDERMLLAVAKILHPWTPPDWLERWVARGDGSGAAPDGSGSPGSPRGDSGAEGDAA